MLSPYQGCSRSGSGGLAVLLGSATGLRKILKWTSEVQFLAKSRSKTKEVSHGVSIAFYLPTRECKRVERVRSQHQLLVQLNLAKIEVQTLYYSEKLLF